MKYMKRSNTYKASNVLFDAKSRCFVLFGPKKQLEKRLIELNKKH